jgi:hypothetical protein
MWDLIGLVAGFATAAILYRKREIILGALRRFDARNAQRQADERRARFDPKAHFRLTLSLAEEQVEEISSVRVSDERTGLPVIRYLFNGEMFAVREDAEAERQSRIAEIARGFYHELDAMTLTSRKPDSRFTPPRP